MLAYHNNINIKNKYVQRMKDHIAADELIRGIGFSEGKGCFIGCTLNNYDHKQFEKELGVPEWLARVFDTIFEGLSLKKSNKFPLEILTSIQPGMNLQLIKAPFLIFVLESTLDKFDHDKFPDVLIAINKVIDLYRNNNLTDAAADAADAADAAYADAADAADAAYAAAAYAARAAAAAGSANAARADVFVRAAARAAAAAAYDSAADAAYAADAAAARAANAAAYDSAAAGNAAAAAYEKFADKLIELIKNCE